MLVYEQIGFIFIDFSNGVLCESTRGTCTACNSFDNVVSWKVCKREWENLPHLISQNTHFMDSNIIDNYEYDTSLKGNNDFMIQLIYHCDQGDISLRIIPTMWYIPTEEDAYFTTWFPRTRKHAP